MSAETDGGDAVATSEHRETAENLSDSRSATVTESTDTVSPDEPADGCDRSASTHDRTDTAETAVGDVDASSYTQMAGIAYSEPEPSSESTSVSESPSITLDGNSAERMPDDTDEADSAETEQTEESVKTEQTEESVETEQTEESVETEQPEEVDTEDSVEVEQTEENSFESKETTETSSAQSAVDEHESPTGGSSIGSRIKSAFGF